NAEGSLMASHRQARVPSAVEGPGAPPRFTLLISVQPEIGGRARNISLAGVRRLHLARARYYIYYRVGTDPGRIEILAFGPRVAAAVHRSELRLCLTSCGVTRRHGVGREAGASRPRNGPSIRWNCPEPSRAHACVRSEAHPEAELHHPRLVGQRRRLLWAAIG